MMMRNQEYHELHFETNGMRLEYPNISFANPHNIATVFPKGVSGYTCTFVGERNRTGKLKIGETKYGLHDATVEVLQGIPISHVICEYKNQQRE